ncbi:hypothetical protein DSL72_004537 [Monilinia vaccinii-corymbosi]|uniref:Cellular morphogenesis protein n=1 Tax=Monilinia vaccinii-corymbosi TaxID=61207 RepID=A0A8A3P8V8_9HELO|nr:hypothetical protein DSL72_004537 [Monilinia vaccinii-corymbosi]
MRLSLWLSPSASDSRSIIGFSFLLSFTPLSTAITFQPAPSAHLDLSNLGRVGLGGDFDGISLYRFLGQNEGGYNTTTQSVMARFPTGEFDSLASADASIAAMCPYVKSDGTLVGVVIGGNFTSLGNVESQGIALFNSNTSAITALPGLSGSVSALLCDQSSSAVYIGGHFDSADSSNVIKLVDNRLLPLPFPGFNGRVNSISKAANGNIIFGGAFTGLGNSTEPVTSKRSNATDQQIVNISGAKIASSGSTTTSGFGDPRNIVCKTSGIDGPGNTWLLKDNSAGFWKATFGFGFQPTKLRLWNTHQDGRGTKTWRYTAQPINGIMNFTYINPATGANASCTSECPLSGDARIPYQDFYFVNSVGMDAFQIDISAWYGRGGGLNGIELFQDDVFAYAIKEFNEPSCASLPTASNTTSTGPWSVSPSFQSVAEYLTGQFTADTASSASVVFYPDIRESGHYTVKMFTPGCIQDNTCSSRGSVVVNGTVADGTSKVSATFGSPITLFQSNDYDKYDQVYSGYIQAASDTFRPSITLTPNGQIPGNSENFTIVAQRVGFILNNATTSGLNGLFEFDPRQTTFDTSDYQNNTIDQAGMALNDDAEINAVVTAGSTTFVGGNFSATSYENIFSISEIGVAPLASRGLNGEVLTMLLDGTTLYVAGTFSSNAGSTTTTGLSNIAAYDVTQNKWSALGAGVNGHVSSVVPISMNITANKPETVITLTGGFDQLLAFGSNASVAVSGFAIWVPSHSNWLQNLNIATMSIKGQLTAAVNASGDYIYAGSISSTQLGTNGVVSLSPGLSPFPVDIHPSTSQNTSSTLPKRDNPHRNISGVVTGLFYENDSRNFTILGGHFTATSTNGTDVHNLVFIDGANGNKVTGLGSEIDAGSTFRSMAIQDDTLYAGGSVTGTVGGGDVNGLILYDLKTSTFARQPPALGGKGNPIVVNDINIRTKTGDLYVGGSFTQAGSLDCPGVCLFTASASQWNRPGTNLEGTVNTMLWASDTTLVVGGSLSVNGANVSLATYDTKGQTWAVANGASSIPGTVTSLVPATSDVSQYWVAGTASNGSVFIMKYDGTNWHSVGNVFQSGSIIRGLQMMPLSSKHDNSDLVPANQVLMVTGAMVLPNFGNVSAVLFNGTTFAPFALTSSTSNTGGCLEHIFSQENNYFKSSGGHLAVGLVVLIALAISLALIFLLVVAGVLAERIRRKREGYVPAPTNSFDQSNGMSKIPPHQLFSSLGHGRSAADKAPMI